MKRTIPIYQGKRLSSKGWILRSYQNVKENRNDRYAKKLLDVSISGIIEATETETELRIQGEVGSHQESITR